MAFIDIRKSMILLLWHLLREMNTTIAEESPATVYTLFTAPASWNTAKNVCWQNHGRLFKGTSQKPMDTVSGFQTKEWQGALDSSDAYWIGLFREAWDDYKWSGQCEILNYKNWDINEPKQTDIDLCTSANYTSGKWSTRPCTDKLPFICEQRRDNGMCTYEKHEDVLLSVFENTYDQDTLFGKTDQGCLDYCSETIDFNGNECWAVAYRSAIALCVAYFSSSSDEVSLTNVRRTQEGELNTSDVAEDLVDNSLTPHIPCKINSTSIVVTTTAPGTAASTALGTDASSSVIPGDTETAVTFAGTITTADTSSNTDFYSTLITRIQTSRIATTHTITTAPASNARTQVPLQTSPAKTSTTGEGKTSPEHAATSTDPEMAARSSVTLTPPSANYQFSTERIGVGQTSDQSPRTVIQTITDSTSNNQNVTNKVCYCRCPTPKFSSPEESAVFIANVVRELSIPKNATSAYKRKYQSVREARPAAVAIGYAGGIIMAVVFGAIILLDVPFLARDIGRMARRLKRHLN